MKTTAQICKAIDLKRFLSIIEDLPTIEKRTAYNFDLPLIQKTTTPCETK
jgi:hypothetical protein